MSKKIYGILIVALCMLGLAGYAMAASPGDLIINEVMQNPNAVSDANGEWFEIYNTTGAGIDIEGWTIQDDGSDSHTISNGSPLVVPAGGYLVLGNNADSGTNGGYTCDYQYSGFTLANGDDEVVLDDGSKAEIARIEYDGGPVWPDPTGASMAFMGDPADNNDGTEWDEECTTTYGDGDYGTPGAANTGCPSPAVPDTVTIYEIQYTTEDSGDCYDSPWLDSTVVTSGIVTATKSGGYWVQDGSAQWCGAYVYDYGFSPSVGDEIQFTCTVAEYYGVTELSSITDLTTLSTGNALPAPLDVLTNTLAGGCEADAEPYEGCLIKLTDVICTTDLDGNNQWWVDDGSGSCQVDPDLYFYDPYVGEAFDYIIGVCNYSYSEFSILPRDADDLNVTPMPDTLSIYEIQYVGAPAKADCFPSDHVGETVVTSGIVHAVKYDGTFWIQDDEAEWCGVYVYEGGTPVVLGDEVQVEGVVNEYNGLTEIGSVSELSILSSGNALFNPLDITTTTLSAEDSCAYPGEPYEGVLVRVTDVQCTALGLYGQWYVNENAKAEACEVDDDLYNLYTPVVGQNYDFITGVVDYSYDQFELLPRDEYDIQEAVAVELTSFEAAAGDGYVTLTWRTAAEVETYSFKIYRNDEVIATVDAFGDAHDYIYVDRQVTNGQTYTYQLSDVDLNGHETLHPVICSVTPTNVPATYALSQNYPNPFNPSTQISYAIPAESHVTLKVYNLLGQEVVTLVDEVKAAGHHAVSWNATGQASGVYFYSLQTDNFSATKKMVFMQ
jgi:hypothetical protein